MSVNMDSSSPRKPRRAADECHTNGPWQDFQHTRPPESAVGCCDHEKKASLSPQVVGGEGCRKKSHGVVCSKLGNDGLLKNHTFDS